MELELELYKASRLGNAAVMHDLLASSNPKLDVNLRIGGWTSLHVACFNGTVPPVQLLLNHPDIDVNLKSESERTPFYLACYWNKLDIVELLLADSRVLYELGDDEACSPLWWAARKGHRAVIEAAMASERDMRRGLTCKAKHLGDAKETRPAEMARLRGYVDLAELLDRFGRTPVVTRHEVRVKLGRSVAVAAEIFALTVLLCDDYIMLTKGGATLFKQQQQQLPLQWREMVRFFALAARLPMELQMLLCHRVVGSAGERVKCKDLEAACGALARAWAKQEECARDASCGRKMSVPSVSRWRMSSVRDAIRGIAERRFSA